jgi:hypothetical protein
VADEEYLQELQRRRATAQLRMCEGLARTLALNVAYAYLLRDAAGATPEQYEAASFGARGYVLAQGRVVLLKAAGVSRRAYEAMPRCSKGRSDVLLAGAAKLGIATGWPGWAAAGCSECGEEAVGECIVCDRPLCDEHRRTTSVPGDSFCRTGEGCTVLDWSQAVL